MVDELTSQSRKALGLCVKCATRAALPLITVCGPCRDAQRAYVRQYRATRPTTTTVTPRPCPMEPATGPNLLACCGRWWPVGHLPYRTPCCGRVYGLVENTP